MTVVGWLILAVVVPTAAAALVALLRLPLPEEVLLLVGFAISALPQVVFGGAAIGHLRAGGIRLRELLLGPLSLPEAISKGVLYGLALVAVQLLVGALISAVAVWVEQWLGIDLVGLAQQEQQGMLELLNAEESPLLIILFVALAVVVAPIVEELFFRGYAYAVFRSRWGVRLAVVASAFVFAIIHFYLALFLTVFAMGILFAIFYERSRSLLSMMIAHSVVNITVTFVAFQALMNPELFA